jgi:N-acetylmuramate 1-kinase
MATPMTPPLGTDDFLRANGWTGAHVSPLAGDASFRRYFRVADGARRAVLMDAPPPHEDPRPFITIAEWLAREGLSAPEIWARDLNQGLLLIEDFGDARLRETLDAVPEREGELYSAATDLLVHLHARDPLDGLSTHGLDQWLGEVSLFTDWYCPALGLEIDRAGWDAAWRELLAPVDADGLPRVTVLRDYHAENIMLLPDRAGVRGLGLLDFQDALIGHPAYDLVSVLEDARRDVTPEVEAAMLARYADATGAGDAFGYAYWASLPGCGSAMASRGIRRFSRACGGCSNAIWRSPGWSGCTPGLPPISRQRRAQRRGQAGCERRDNRIGAGTRGGTGQTHASAYRHAAQAAGARGGQSADRP